jgi:hypothetical protein
MEKLSIISRAFPSIKQEGDGFGRVLPTVSHAGSARVTALPYLAMFFTESVACAVDERPAPSVTVSVTVYVPFEPYEWLDFGFASVTADVPSPKVHEKLVIPESSEDADASKVQLFLLPGQLKLNRALGAAFGDGDGDGDGVGSGAGAGSVITPLLDPLVRRSLLAVPPVTPMITLADVAERSALATCAGDALGFD